MIDAVLFAPAGNAAAVNESCCRIDEEKPFVFGELLQKFLASAEVTNCLPENSAAGSAKKEAAPDGSLTLLGLFPALQAMPSQDNADSSTADGDNTAEVFYEHWGKGEQQLLSNFLRLANDGDVLGIEAGELKIAVQSADRSFREGLSTLLQELTTGDAEDLPIEAEEKLQGLLRAASVKEELSTVLGKKASSSAVKYEELGQHLPQATKETMQTALNEESRQTEISFQEKSSAPPLHADESKGTGRKEKDSTFPVSKPQRSEKTFRVENRQEFLKSEGGQAGHERLSALYTSASQTKNIVSRARVLTLPPAQLWEEVVQRVEHMVGGGSDFGELRVQLKPQVLGEVSIKLRFQEGRLMVEVFTSNPAVKEFLEGSFQDLKTRLQLAEMELGKMDVYLHNDGFAESEHHTAYEAWEENCFRQGYRFLGSLFEKEGAVAKYESPQGVGYAPAGRINCLV
jgi:hypothetical protein